MSKVSNILVVFIVVLGLTLPSCNQFESFTHFKIKYTQSAVVQSSVGVDLPFNINTPPRETNAEQEFKNNDTQTEFVQSIFLNEGRLEITAPEGEDFSFLQKITLYIKSDGLDEIELASLDPVPADAGSIIDLVPTQADLQEYIKKEKFSLRLNVVTDEILTRDHHFNIYSTYSVKAEILE